MVRKQISHTKQKTPILYREIFPLSTTPVPLISSLQTRAPNKTEQSSLPSSNTPKTRSFYSNQCDHFKILIISARNSCMNFKGSKTASAAQTYHAPFSKKNWTSTIISYSSSQIFTGSTHIYSTTNAWYIWLSVEKLKLTQLFNGCESDICQRIKSNEFRRFAQGNK